MMMRPELGSCRCRSIIVVGLWMMITRGVVVLLLVMLSALPSRTNNNDGREEEEGVSRIPFVWRPYRSQCATPHARCIFFYEAHNSSPQLVIKQKGKGSCLSLLFSPPLFLV